MEGYSFRKGMGNKKTKYLRNGVLKRVFLFGQKEYDSLLLFVGMFLLFYLGMNLIRSQILINNLNKPEYLYHKEFFADGIWNKDMFDETFKMLKGSGANCVIRGFMVSVGLTNEHREVRTYLSAEALAKKEKLDYDEWMGIPNSVLIAGRLLNRTYLREGKKWIIIDGIEFQVYAVIESDVILAQSVYMNWGNLEEDYKEWFMWRLADEYDTSGWNGIPLIFEKLTKFHDEINNFQDQFEDCLTTYENYDDYEQWDRQELYEKMQKIYSVMELFCIFVIFYLMEVWFARRKREYLIRRMLGCNALSLCKTAFRDAILIAGSAFFVAVIVMLLQLCFHIAGKLEVLEVLQTIVGSFIITIGFEILMLGFHVLRLINIYPTQANIEAAE